MKNTKLVAWGMITSIGIAFFSALTSDDDTLYTIAGLGMIVFGIWSAVLLLKYQEAE